MACTSWARGARRARIAREARRLFGEHGYAETTVEQIAAAAGVEPYTVTALLPTKVSMLLEPITALRRRAVRRLRSRPVGEAPLVSLLAVVRGLLALGQDREYLIQLWTLIVAEPDIVGAELASLSGSFEAAVEVELAARPGAPEDLLEIRALVAMVSSWTRTAVQVWMVEDRVSLARTFDEVMTVNMRAMVGLQSAVPSGPL